MLSQRWEVLKYKYFVTIDVARRKQTEGDFAEILDFSYASCCVRDTFPTQNGNDTQWSTIFVVHLRTDQTNPADSTFKTLNYEYDVRSS